MSCNHLMVFGSRRRVAAWLSSAALVLACAACGRAPMAPTPTLEGTWQGTIESVEDGSGDVTLRFTQTGLAVSGPLVVTQNGLTTTGALDGTLTTSEFPTTMRYTVSYEFGPFQCRGTFSGTATVSASRLEGTFTGENCVHAFSGVLRAAKTP